MKFEIKNRWNGSVIFEAEFKCTADASEGIKLGLAVKVALKARANLTDAYLAGANLARANLADANLAGANLARANLADANLTGANLAHANLADANLTDANLTGAYLADAYLARANLARANLTDANLRTFKADMWLTLAQNRSEVPGLIQALRDGRVDGSVYDGECACLVGTVANLRGVDVGEIEHDPDHPAERWFLMINKGDKPGDDTGGGFAAKKALEWAEEFATLHGIDIDSALSSEPSEGERE